MHSSSLFLSAAVSSLLLGSAYAEPKFEKIHDAAITLDLNARQMVPVPGGTQMGIPVTNITTTSDNFSQWDGAACTGYSWTTTYDADTEAEHVTVIVRLNCETADGVPFTALEEGSGKTSSTALRRIEYEIGAPYEHMRSEFYMVEVNTPAPDMTASVYKVVQ